MAVLTRDAIRALQTLLARIGHDPGPADGVWGRRTAAAVAAWQADNQSPPAPSSARPSPASGPIIHQGAARYPVDEIVVHCAATRPDWMARNILAEQIKEIRRWHVLGNGWVREGYHWFIGRDGLLLPGRPETMIGAHVVERNKGSIGICVIGGFGSAETDRFLDHFTRAQDTTLRQQIEAIKMRTRISRISGHNEYAAKACPGFTVSDWLRGDL